MAISAIYKTFRDGVTLVEDGTTPTPLAVTLQYEDGDISFEGLNEGNCEVVAVQDRGEHAGLRKGKRSYATLSFSAYMTDLSDASELTLPDIILKQNAFAAAVSTSAATGDVYTLDVTWTVTYGGETHVLKCEDVHLSLGISEGDPANKFSVSGTVYGSISMT